MVFNKRRGEQYPAPLRAIEVSKTLRDDANQKKWRERDERGGDKNCKKIINFGEAVKSEKGKPPPQKVLERGPESEKARESRLNRRSSVIFVRRTMLLDDACNFAKGHVDCIRFASDRRGARIQKRRDCEGGGGGGGGGGRRPGPAPPQQAQRPPPPPPPPPPPTFKIGSRPKTADKNSSKRSSRSATLRRSCGG
jgi:hypothetical protein